MESIIILSGFAVVLFFGILFVVSFGEGRTKKRAKISKKEISPSGRFGKIKDVAYTYLHQMSIVAIQPDIFLTVTASSLLIWGMDILTCYLVLKAFPTAGINLFSTYTISLIFLAVAIGNIAKTFPITSGAIGTYEVALTAILGLGGIKPEIAFTVVVLDHIIKNAITLIGGIFALSELVFRWKEVLLTNKEFYTNKDFSGD